MYDMLCCVELIGAKYSCLNMKYYCCHKLFINLMCHLLNSFFFTQPSTASCVQTAQVSIMKKVSSTAFLPSMVHFYLHHHINTHQPSVIHIFFIYFHDNIEI